MMAVPRSLLLVRPDRIGDMMHVTPVLRALAAAHPGMRVGVLARGPGRLALAGNPHVAEVVDGRRPAAELRAAIDAGGWEAVVHLITERDLLAACAGIPRSARRGWLPWPGRHRLVPVRRSRSRQSEALYNADLVRALVPGLVVDPRPEFRCSAEDEAFACEAMPEPAPLLNPGSGHPEGAWPEERFAALARALAPRLGTPLVLWGPGEEALAGRIAAAGGCRLAPPTTLGRLAALAARCPVMVSNDTGPMHVAAAAGAPLVVVWDGSRAIRPRRWGHDFRPDIANLDPFDGTGDAPAERRARLERIGVDRVLAEAERVAALGRERSR